MQLLLFVNKYNNILTTFISIKVLNRIQYLIHIIAICKDEIIE